MSEKSERIDLNSDVFSSEPENEAAAAEANRLKGHKKAAMDGSSVEEEEEEEAKKVRVLEGESEKQGLETEVSDVVHGGRLGNISLNVLESEGCNGKDESLRVNKGPLGSLDGEPNVESHKPEEDLVGNDTHQRVSFEGEKEKAFGEMEKDEISDFGVSSVVNSGSSLGDSGHARSLETVEPKTTESADSVRKLKDYAPKSDKGASTAVNSSTSLGNSSHPQSLETVDPKITESADSVKKLKDDAPKSEKGTSTALNLSLKLENSGHPQSLETVDSKTTESAESVRELKDDAPKSDEGASTELNSSLKIGDSSYPQSLETVKPETMESAESVRESKDDAPTVVVEEKVDMDECLAQSDSKVSSECGTALSDGLQNRVLEVHLEAETKETSVPKGSGNESNSFNIVIDLNSKSPASKPELGVGDLVWAKVRSHPWWPGQVCDPKAASQKAKKYSKRDAYLIAYFGDNTFAWNEASMVKPFLENFTQMEKHSNTEDFHHAIACALDEVSRRVEFGLACSCLSEEVYAKVKTQIIVNAGIEEELSRRDGGDSSLTVTSFEPVKLVGYIKQLAQAPYDVAHDRLELTLARSRLLAFYRFKGYSQLPEFNMLGGIMENDADVSSSTAKKHCNKASAAADLEHEDDIGSVSERGKSKGQNSSSLKRKLTSGDNSTRPSKKEKSLLDLMAEKRMKTPTGGKGSEGKTTKKRTADVAMSNNTPVKEKKSFAIEVDNKPLQIKQTFRVGDSIRRVASQLNGSSSIFKNGNDISYLPQTKSKEKTVSEESEPRKLAIREHSSEETLSQLCIAAKDPMRVNNSSLVTFFSEFRDTISLAQPCSEENEESLEDFFGGKNGKEPTKGRRKSSMSGELPHQLGSTNESYWSERIGRSVAEDQNERGEFPLGTREKERSQAALDLDSEQKTSASPAEKEKSQRALDSDSEQKTSGSQAEKEDLSPTEADKPAVDHLTNNSKEDLTPTALILNFTDMGSVPSETNLNKIFSNYGPLDELETKVFKKSSRAKVVFKRCSDAETAFSSAGKYSTFGPSLVSYRLKYLSSSPSKASLNLKKQSKTDQASSDDNTK